MKNISRRVFIKGMAVAAVATAASTVLTGCKLPAGVTDAATSAANNLPQTKTITVDGKTFTITAEAFGKNTDGSYSLKLKVVNDLGKDVTVCVNPASHTHAAAMTCVADLDGMGALSIGYTDALLGQISTDLGGNDYTFKANAEGSDHSSELTLVLPNPSTFMNTSTTIIEIDQLENWKVLTLSFALSTTNKKGDPVVEEVSFSFNRV